MIFRITVLLAILSCSGCGKGPEYIKINKPLPSNEIFFNRYQFGIFESKIWAMDRDGENQVEITEKLHLPPSFCVSSDGKKIGLVYHSKPIRFEIWIIEIGEEKVKRRKVLIRNNPIGNLSFSPDGEKIVLEMTDSKGNRDIYIINSSNGETLKRLTNDSYWDSSPSWSPDGKRIIFSHRVEGEGWKIYIMNADDTNVERLTDSPQSTEEKSSTWSPDGKWIAFEEVEKYPDESGKRWQGQIIQKIILINPQSKEKIKLLTLPRPLIFSWNMCFSPDGKHLAFQATDAKNRNDEIYTIDIDGKNLKNLTNTTNWVEESSPSWRPIAKD